MGVGGSESQKTAQDYRRTLQNNHWMLNNIGGKLTTVQHQWKMTKQPRDSLDVH